MGVDCDMYSSTLEVLCNLYEFLHVGGYCFIDDFNIKESRRAVLDFRRAHNITTQLVAVGDDSGVWFAKGTSVSISAAWCGNQLGKSPIVYRHPSSSFG